MSIGKSALLVVALLATAACSGKPAQGDGSIPANAPAPTHSSPASVASTPKDGTHMDENSAQAASIAPPKASDVLEAIYQKDSHGQESMPIANGSEATYWYGHAFEWNGKRYFTGFAYDTPDKFGQQGDDTLPAPDAKVTLTEATFEWAKGPASPAWTLVEAERFIGEFGGYEKADAVDTQAAAQSVTTTDGKLMLAVPTWYLASGTRIKSFSLFVYNPAPSSDPNQTTWTYLGNIARGEDNGASCDADGSGNHVPCVDGSGALTFAASGTGVPDVRVALSGTGLDASGQKKTYGAADIATYRFNPQSKTYEAAH